MATRQIMDLTVCGSFGFGNAGDEAVPLALQDLAASLEVELDLAVIGRYAEVDMPEVIGLGLQDADRRASRRASHLMFVGGGVIEPRQQCVLLRGQQLLQELKPRQVSMFACSVEPGVSFSWGVRRRLRRALNGLHHCSIRDVLSLEAMATLSSGDIQVVGDIVLWMNAVDRVDCVSAAVGDYIAVNLASRWSDDSAFMPWLCLHLIKLSKELNASIVFVPCSAKFDNDGNAHHLAAASIRSSDSTVDVKVIDRPLEPRELAAVVRDAKLTIGMRLHACIISYAQRTPCVGLVYHPKLIGFARTMGIERWFLPNQPPTRQSAGFHGYRSEDLNIVREDLAATALDAVSAMRFNQLEETRIRLRETFASTLGLNPSDAIAPSNAGVTT